MIKFFLESNRPRLFLLPPFNLKKRFRKPVIRRACGLSGQAATSGARNGKRLERNPMLSLMKYWSDWKPF